VAKKVYGPGEPLLLVHANGGSIGQLKPQIEHFRKRYMVIAMDSRDHGNSADSRDAITYEKMADDLAALLDHVKTQPAYALGWSDGGIEALLLGIRHPAKVKKIAINVRERDSLGQAAGEQLEASVSSWRGCFTVITFSARGPAGLS
jgi:pimeloyl-ACP methyl ester carboxylesterase